jgi:hypothetical protein
MLRRYPWSSYRSYIGAVRRLDYVDDGPIRAMIEPSPSGPPRAYRRFVEAGIEQVDAAFLEAARASPLCLGCEEFCERMRRLYHRLCDDKPRQEDVAFRRLPRRVDVEVILECVCRRLAVDRGSLLRTRRDSGPRAVAARMLCDHGDLTQRQVAQTLGLRSGAAVSKQLRLLTHRLESDRDLREAVAAISRDLAAS